ncbi:MAG: hypothetical protein R2909_02050 [Gemmatimonadales bacterium]
MRAGCVLIAVALLGCADGESADRTAGAPAAAGVVDSVVPMNVALERFTSGLERPAGLRSTARSRDELVGTMIDAVARNDTTAFEALAVDQAEFGYLYYPTTRTAQPPYELPPSLAWFQMQERNRRGVFRMLRDYGGRELVLRGLECAAEPTVEAENRIWSECRVSLTRDGEAITPIKLFGAILERDGRYAFLSFANDL